MSPAGSSNAPEARARARIDQALTDAGWTLQDRDAMNLAAADAITVREFKLAKGHGYVDYMLFLDGHPDQAVVEIEKLQDYSLNPEHEEGKHKARVFVSALGLTHTDAEWLRERLLAAAFDDATESGRSRFGTLYVVDSEVAREGRTATVRSGWIVRQDENFPRLVTCFVKSKS